MLMLLFAAGMLWVFGKLFIMSIRAAWGISKFLLTIVFLPVILIGMAVGGLLYAAFLILLVVAVLSRLCSV